MRKIYLIRHAMPDIPIGERWCIGGQTDIPLGKAGRLQAALLPFVPELQGLDAVFCSSLIRARETALPLCPSPREMPGIQEQDMGVWDGLSFREIRQRFPALYAARELDPSLMPEGAESSETVRRRMTAGILRCLRESEGDIAVVSHKGAIRRCGAEMTKIPVDDPGILHDADTPEDYRALLEYHNEQLIRPEISISLSRERPFFDERTAMLLALVDETKSVRTACQRMQISYSGSWNIIHALESQLHFPLLERSQGGANGGESRLTEKGKRLLECYQGYAQRLRQDAAALFEEYFGDEL